eukprot:TRINITY_DN890_c0_g1_i6.p1 TRINITY_DN890_c0_g1~~TRINITY_DN890_c0_g1_i6.p1  ORF type:complete len:307 (-),score=56.25 TRINITY_DN890_c0_g1_i6:90-1010(-)
MALSVSSASYPLCAGLQGNASVRSPPQSCATFRPLLGLQTSLGMPSEQRTRAQIETRSLRTGIAEFYDESSSLWESIWGDHMHHGFYDATDSSSASDIDHREAQFRMIEEALTFAGVSEEDGRKPRKILDVGCGIGGSSRYLAKKYSARVEGISLSPFQVQRASQLASEQDLAQQVSFQVADALNQPFSDNSFDLVWSMESGEHMPDKEKFLKELVRVAAPGGYIIIVTWCHRDLLPGETSLKDDEKEFLDRICRAFYLPAWCSRADYVKLAQTLSLEVCFQFPNVRVTAMAVSCFKLRLITVPSM